MRSFKTKCSKEFLWRGHLYLNEKRIFTMAVVSLEKKWWTVFVTHLFFFNAQTRKFFTTHIILFFKNKKIRLINPLISNTQVDKCNSNHGGEWHNTCKLEARYNLIPLRRSNIVNHGIASKHRWCTMFGWTIMKYTFTSPLPKLESKGKVMHIHTLVQKYMWTW